MHRLVCASADDFAGLYALRIWQKNLCALFILLRTPIQFTGTPNKAIKLWIKVLQLYLQSSLIGYTYTFVDFIIFITEDSEERILEKINII